jgi:AcrR family transcriptional regulator
MAIEVIDFLSALRVLEIPDRAGREGTVLFIDRSFRNIWQGFFCDVKREGDRVRSCRQGQRIQEVPMTTSRRKPKNSEETRSVLMDCAARLFREKGYDSTSLKDLAIAVGVSPSAMYWYFPSKNDLLYSVIKRTLHRFEDGMAMALSKVDDTPPSRLAAFVRYYVQTQLSGSSEVATYSYVYATGHMLDHLPEATRAELRGIERRIFRFVRGTIQQGVDRGCFSARHAGTTALAIIGMCEHVQTWFRPDGKDTAGEIADRYADLCLTMVAYRPDPHQEV